MREKYRCLESPGIEKEQKRSRWDESPTTSLSKVPPFIEKPLGKLSEEATRHLGDAAQAVNVSCLAKGE
jgi:hypothetical protein